MPTATWLADALRSGGCVVDETRVPDWRNRGHSDGPVGPWVGVLGHHTAGSATGDLPSLSIVRDGRPDLAGPLANLMLSRSGVWVPIAAGRTWHAGTADKPAAWPWVPKGDGNGHLIGIEAESCGTCDDWTPAQRAAYPQGVAALLRYMGAPVSHFLGHKEWAPTRKVDPAFWDLNGLRSQAAAILTKPQTPTTPEEDDMPLTEADLNAVYGRVQAALRDWRDGANPNRNLLELATQVRNDIYFTQSGTLQALGQTDEQVAAALKPLLTDVATTVATSVAAAAKSGGGLSDEQVRDIAVQAVADKLAGTA